MKRNGENKTNQDSITSPMAANERSLEANFLHRKIKETGKILIRHREKISKLREQESVLEEELRNLGRVVEMVEKYEQIKLPHLSLGDPVEVKPEKVLV